MKTLFIILQILAVIFLSQNSVFSETYEIQIPTRVEETDKKYLAADLHSEDTTTAKPVILIQTPYNKNLMRFAFENPGSGIQLEVDYSKYNYVILDWRGSFGSKDAAIDRYDRGIDGYDAVEWIAGQTWCNGKVATWGSSALGLIQYQTAAQQPPHLVCCQPSVKCYRTTYYSYYFGGVLRKEHLEDLLFLGFNTGIVRLYPDYNNYWKIVENSTDIADKIKVPMLVIGGWYDLDPTDILEDFHGLLEKSDESVRDRHKLIYGPWQHSDLGQSKQGVLDYPNTTNIPKEASSRFFGYYLLGEKNNWPGQPKVKYYEMGTDQWKATDDFYNLKRDEIKLFLHPDRTLKSGIFDSTESVTNQFISNPKDPVPAIGGARLSLNQRLTGPQDQRFKVENRKDVLVYQTDQLEEPVVLNGRMKVRLYFESDRTDTDISLRLCDVYPDGKSILVRQAIHRGRYAQSTDEQKLLEPGEIYQMDITFDELAITFLKGHRLKIIISGSCYPVFDINQNNGGDQNEAGDTLSAVIKIHQGSKYRSSVIIPTLSTTKVQDVKIKETKVYPNPADDHIFLDNTNNFEKYKIFDVYGKEFYTVQSRLHPGNNNINISGMRTGIYQIMLYSNDYIKTIKFIKY